MLFGKRFSSLIRKNAENVAAIDFPLVESSTEGDFIDREFLFFNEDALLMIVKNIYSFLAFAFVACTTGFASAAIIMSDAGTTAPAAGDGFANTGTGGTGGNPYSDNGGLGQSFTLPSGSNYDLNSFSLMYDGDNDGGDSFGTGATWDVQVSRFDNVGSGGFAERLDIEPGFPHTAQYLSNSFINHQYLDFATITEPDVGDWVTVDFTGGDVLTLAGGHTYAIQLRSDTGWSRWSTSATDNYTDAKRFGSWGEGNNFVNPSNSTAEEYTFVLNLTEVAVPEPSSLVLLAGLAVSGMASLRQRS